MKKKIFSFLVMLILTTPLVVDAIGSARCSVSRPSISRSSSVHVSSKSYSKPSSGSFSTKSSKISSKSSNKSTINKNATSNKYTIKPKLNKVTKPYKVNKSYYSSHYSSQPIYINNNSSFWNYYGLAYMLNDKDDISEEDVAIALAEKGYSQNEIRQIMDDLDEDNNKNHNVIFIILVAIAILVIVGIIISVILL